MREFAIFRKIDHQHTKINFANHFIFFSLQSDSDFIKKDKTVLVDGLNVRIKRKRRSIDT